MARIRDAAQIFVSLTLATCLLFVGLFILSGASYEMRIPAERCLGCSDI